MLQRVAYRAAIWGTAFGLVGALQWGLYHGNVGMSAFCIAGAAVLTALVTTTQDAVSGRTADF